MKRLLVWVGAVGGGLPLYAQSPLQMKVERISKKHDSGERTEGMFIYAADYAASMALRVTITNTAPKPVTGVKIKWGIVKTQVRGYSATRGVEAAYGAEQKFDLKPMEKKIIETESVEAGGRHFNDGETHGDRIHGHGVQLTVADKLIAEEFVPGTPGIRKAFENMRPVGDQEKPEKPGKKH